MRLDEELVTTLTDPAKDLRRQLRYLKGNQVPSVCIVEERYLCDGRGAGGYPKDCLPESTTVAENTRVVGDIDDWVGLVGRDVRSCVSSETLAAFKKEVEVALEKNTNARGS